MKLNEKYLPEWLSTILMVILMAFFVLFGLLFVAGAMISIGYVTTKSVYLLRNQGRSEWGKVDYI